MSTYYSRKDFGNDFKWGVAASSYQIEGAHDADGKGLSIWDHFTRKGKRIKDGSTGNVACDFYNQYTDDISLINDLNIPNFRFSLSWPRILPTGTGKVNEAGIDFYQRVIDSCLEKGITPWLTLYHWDLPLELERKGGWTNRDIHYWFAEYADVCSRRFGDRVKNWFVMNEPFSFTALGYLVGYFAPGRYGIHNFLPAVHHSNLCQAEGGRIIRRNVPDANIGTTFSCSYVRPVNDHPANIRAANRVDALFNRLYIEPSLGLDYPIRELPVLERIEKYIHPYDAGLMKFDYDFIGLQNYYSLTARSMMFMPYLKAFYVPFNKLNRPLTANGWEVYPTGIYHILKQFSKYPIRQIMVTENGAAFRDKVVDGRVHDVRRTKYLQDYIGQVLRAKREGVNVNGYFIWTLMDNFEWRDGFKSRFGIVHVDFKHQTRIIKDSGLWMKEFLGE